MSFIAFIVASLLGLALLSGALVVALGTLMNSILAALAIVGGVYIALALVIYFVSLRGTLQRWQQRLGTIYDVSATIDILYREAVGWVKKIVGGI